MADIQPLIRFLAQNASIPLASALAIAKPLHSAGKTPEALASTTVSDISSLIGTADPDGKIAKQIHNAAKRSAKKRASGDTDVSSPSKRRKNAQNAAGGLNVCPPLPPPNHDEEAIRATVVYTNRAPLLLAFAVTLLKYTHPAQPEDSRLSLGMAVVSAGAKAKGRDLGIIQGRKVDAAEELGRGHRSLKLLSRDVPVLRRERDVSSQERSGDKSDGVQAEDGAVEVRTESKGGEADEEEAATQETIGRERCEQDESEDWYWGLDLDAMAEGKAGLPVHTARSAYDYLRGAFPTPASARIADDGNAHKTKDTAKKRSSAMLEEKEHNLSLVLGAIDLLFQSWAGVLSRDDLDRRAWTWYAKVRPAVEHGRSGWGGKGDVRLEEILKLCR